ncbi:MULTISPECIES: hypothetical protein [unclassified Ensifer]|uniref:hypothetical protein n=1 Tax=unclassified Ensifer TaxID=2633371 RepID=UPI000812F45C|nr:MULTISPECIES: hypothetical protein [unclassified Ensifer]OCO98923.1 hypothetical protein BC362_27165 [Ensifer sp. LC14]OCP04457.1 hypothetical protein BBX50_25795 [Ensifer sp. LC11]OCP04737.1 hypothetical protein BC374_25810 [Ensifer sp. LC13]OCP30561.1 hypothetical protein BC364_25825 [Ensifer sp. LC499]
MTQQDKAFGRKGLPDRIQSLREAIDYFDESPLLQSKPMAEARMPRGAEARFRHPSAGTPANDIARGGLLLSQADPGPGRFDLQNGVLPTERFRPLMADHRSDSNIASEPRSRDSAAEVYRTRAVEKSNRDGSHDIGWSDFGSLLGSAVGALLGSGAASVAGTVGGYYAGGYGPGLLKETGRAVGRGGFNGDLSGLR